MTRVPPARAQMKQEIQDRGSVDAVEIAGRLVGKDELRIVDDAARDGDALTFAAGQLLRRCVRGRSALPSRALLRPGVAARTAGAGADIATSTFSLAVSVGNRLKS